MKTILLKTNLHCNGCVSKVEPLLKADNRIKNIAFNLNHPDKIISIEAENIDLHEIVSRINQAGYSAEEITEQRPFVFTKFELPKTIFWSNLRNWKRASFNTLNCLIGCSIGDFGMIVFLQAFFPATSMAWQMVLATIAGLCTSVALESVILKTREKFNWSLAFRTALSMSFISMVAMEFAMNTADFMFTGGKAAFDTLAYWAALVPALAAGFLFPLPYNYYKLQKFGKSCH